MALRDGLTRIGLGLFRWRSYIPLLVLAAVIAAILARRGQPITPRPLWLFAGLAVSGFGIAIRVMVAGHVPHNTSGRNTHGQVADALNTTGLYSMLRHPLYLGNYFMWLGLLMYLRSPWLVVAVSAAFWLYYGLIMLAEDSWLGDVFGDTHAEWARRTPAVVPDPRRWRPPALGFSLRTALRREYTGVFTVIALFTLFHVLREWAATGRLFLEPGWAAFFGLGLVAYLSLRFAKRHTRLLRVPGR